jgi:hypothetical protein
MDVAVCVVKDVVRSRFNNGVVHAPAVMLYDLPRERLFIGFTARKRDCIGMDSRWCTVGCKRQ